MSTREKILKEAGKLFYRRGVHAIGMEAICQSAGITKPTLYYYFKSKDDLITRYITETSEHFFQTYCETIEKTEGSLLDKIDAWIELTTNMTSHHKWNGCAFHRLASDLNAQKEHPAYQEALNFKSRWEDWLANYLDIKKISSSESKARMLIIALDGAVAHATLHGDKKYFDAAKQIARLIL